MIGHGAAWLPPQPRQTLGISHRKSHTATSCWAHEQWPLSLADMVWPQLRLPCLANHKSSTFKQLERWKIDESSAPWSANKNRTQQKKPSSLKTCPGRKQGLFIQGLFSLYHTGWKLSDVHRITLCFNCSIVVCKFASKIGLYTRLVGGLLIGPERFRATTTYSHRLLSCYELDSIGVTV